MSTPPSRIPIADALQLSSLIAPVPQGIASRVLAKNGGGSLTLFAFDAGQELNEHSAPFDAMVIVLEGAVDLTIDGRPVHAASGTIVLMPANVPHAVKAPEAARMLLLTLREARPASPS